MNRSNSIRPAVAAAALLTLGVAGMGSCFSDPRPTSASSGTSGVGGEDSNATSGPLGGKAGASKGGTSGSAGRPAGGSAGQTSVGGVSSGDAGAAGGLDCTQCGPDCVDLQTDPENCGACDSACGDSGEGRCQGGYCTRCVYRLTPFTTPELTAYGSDTQQAYLKSCTMPPASGKNVTATFCATLTQVPTGLTSPQLQSGLVWVAPAVAYGASGNYSSTAQPAQMRVYDTVAIPEDGNVAAAIFAHDCTGYSGNTYSGCALAYSDLNAKAPTLVLETAGAVPTPSGLCP